MAKGRGRENVREAIETLDNANKHVLVTGLGLLTVGTLLGGVWANESWGRYWGWDAKETWSLITILVYAVVLHFRWIPQMRSVWLNAAGQPGGHRLGGHDLLRRELLPDRPAQLRPGRCGAGARLGVHRVGDGVGLDHRFRAGQPGEEMDGWGLGESLRS